MLKDTDRLIHRALHLASRLVESDTEVSTVDLNLLENLNTNQSLNYIKLELNLARLEQNTSKYSDLVKEFRNYQRQLEETERHAHIIESLAKELDMWSKELEAATQKNP